MTPHIALDTPPVLVDEIRTWRWRFLILGVAALLAAAAGAFLWPDQFLRSYIWSYTFYVGLTLGCLAFAMLQYVTGGAWGVVIVRLCEAASRTLPLLALLFIPIAVGIPRLYVWARPAVVASDEVIRHKSMYLNTPFFLARTAIYFAGWMLLAWLLNRWSVRQDGTGAGRAYRGLRSVSAVGLLFYGYSVTFMCIDWIMSLNPHWYSTMFGMLFVAGQGLSAMAFVICLVVILTSWSPFAEAITARHLHDLGKLLLAFVMLWAYLAFSQFLIVWAGNLPEEIPWYLNRMRGGWQYLALVLVALHFAFPFALLLSRDVKRNFRLLTSVAVLILIMRYVDLYWLVAPDFRQGVFGVSWMDFVLPIGLGGLWLATFSWQLTRRPLLPVNDPHLEAALAHGRE